MIFAAAAAAAVAVLIVAAFYVNSLAYKMAHFDVYNDPMIRQSPGSVSYLIYSNDFHDLLSTRYKVNFD